MISFWRIFSLEIKALWRSKALILLAIASIGWLLVLPRFLRDDGTAAGARELYVRYGLGGAFILITLSLLAAATASLAKERVKKRLQLTMVRPVSAFAIVFAKMLAHVFAGAVILLTVILSLCTKVDIARQANHVLRPILPSPKEEAEIMYKHYMEDNNTPKEIKEAPKSLIVRILTTRAFDRYESIPTNMLKTWKFPISELSAEMCPSVRLRFTNQLGMCDDVLGEFKLGDYTGKLDNVTKAIITLPLHGKGAISDTLSFMNLGSKSLMLRPRRDIELLIPAESFAVNLVFTYLELVMILFAAIGFGMMLSACLSRPVALFTAIVVLIVGEIAPSIVEEYPDELGASMVDRAGLYIARTSSALLRPVAGLKPITSLAADERVETREVVEAFIVNGVILPIILAFLGAFVLPRKEEPGVS